VTSGLKRSRSAASNKERRGGPCVIFVVRRKWKKPAAGAKARQKIPRYLLAFWGSGQSRTICAVPTDIITEHGLYDTAAGALSGVRVGRDGKAYGGNVACVVRVARTNGTTEDMMLSALHVFSPLPEINTLPPARGAVIQTLPELGLDAIGRSAAIGGALWSDSNAGEPRRSFDVQLASIDSLPSLMQALEGYSLSSSRPYLRGLQELHALGATKLRILASPNNPKRIGSGARKVTARYEKSHPPEAGWPYDVAINSVPTRDVLIHPGWLVDLELLSEPTAPGDSGSPVVVELENDGFTLVGMHIARSDHPDGTFSSVIIPAWQLFEADRYKSGIAAIEPISPELAQ
jgi:hypothetical protein